MSGIRSQKPGTVEGTYSSSSATTSSSSFARVRKRRGRPSVILMIAFCLVFTSLKSTYSSSQPKPGGGGGEAGALGSQQHHGLRTNSLKTGGEEGRGREIAEEGESSSASSPVREGTERSTERKHHSTTEGSSSTEEETVTEPPSQTTESSPMKEKNETKAGNETEAKTTPESEYCVPPAIRQFPRPLLGQNIRKHGGFVLYLLIAAYTFLALAIVCDEFFVPSLDIICELMKISPDVAGATFMAAGSSAPELATALIGVFVAEDDIGISGVIGSAVFNIMFVISICSLLTPTVLYLNWWPMFRDCFFYMVSILALLVTILDEKIEWYESIFLLLLYVVYCFAMYMNTVLEAWAHTLPIPFPVINAPIPDENSGLVTYKAGGGGAQGGKGDHGAISSSTTGGVLHGGENIVVEGLEPTLSVGPYSQDAWDGGSGVQAPLQNTEGNYSTGGMGAMDGGTEPPKKVQPPAESILSHLNPPPDSSMPKKILWKISSPLIYLFYYTVPDCRLEAWRTWYVVTFIASMVWIAIFSYIMVWMITIVGFTAGVPDTVMGLTFVAAGVSVPDALSSLAVVKEGFGDMAVSNAIGSNVFDILVCLGLPWFISTALVHPGVPVKVISKGLIYSTFSLLSTVAFLLIATHYNGWKLDKRYGILLMLWYLFFMIFASLYELNVFGPFNPRECYSDY